MTFNVPDEITCSFHDDKVKFSLDGLSTGWMDRDDLFIERIDKSVLNSVFLKEHIIKEIEIKNALDEAKRYLDTQKFSKAIKMLDEILFYDSSYGEALIFKSCALFGQRKADEVSLACVKTLLHLGRIATHLHAQHDT